ncbi:hypothetical protein [Pseudomonas aeruginosa]
MRLFDRVVHCIVFYPVFSFILAGLCEIGGGYLIWLWLR